MAKGSLRLVDQLDGEVRKFCEDLCDVEISEKREQTAADAFWFLRVAGDTVGSLHAHRHRSSTRWTGTSHPKPDDDADVSESRTGTSMTAAIYFALGLGNVLKATVRVQMDDVCGIRAARASGLELRIADAVRSALRLFAEPMRSPISVRASVQLDWSRVD